MVVEMDGLHRTVTSRNRDIRLHSVQAPGVFHAAGRFFCVSGEIDGEEAIDACS